MKIHRFSDQYHELSWMERAVTTIDEVKAVLVQTLRLDGSARFQASTGLLGNIPEFDSMAVVGVVTALEERFGIIIDDEEINAQVFETIGSLVNFVEGKIESR